MNGRNFFAELKRRNVYKVAVAYAVVAWLLIQAASILFPTYEAPAWVMKVFVAVVALGFPIALVISWAFEMTPEGMKRTENVPVSAKLPHWSKHKFITVFAILALFAAALFVWRLVGTARWSVRSNADGRRSAASLPEKSIAVLPFENLSSDKENAYFADGIQDEIVTKLATIGDLKVISRTSTAKYKSKPEDVKTVAEQLGVANVLEGSVQRAGDKVRVNVQLIDARADSHLWAKSYDGDAKDIFGVESEVSQQVADALRARLSPAEAKTIATAPTEDTEAHDLFLKGDFEYRLASSSRKAEQYDEATAWYERAIARDPKFALAISHLVICRLNRHWFVESLTDDQLAQIKRTAEHAIAVGPSVADAHVALGLYYYYGYREYEQALVEFERALQVQPNNALTLEYSGYVHRRLGQWQVCIAELTRALELDPRSADVAGNLGQTYGLMREWKQAERIARSAVSMDPHDIIGMRALLTTVINSTGDMTKAAPLLQSLPLDEKLITTSISGTVGSVTGERAYTFILQRDFAGALKVWEAPATNAIDERKRLAARTTIRLLSGDLAAAKTEAEQALPVLERRVQERPNELFSLRQLSWVLLAVGRNAEALQVAHRVADLLPPDHDALLGPATLAGLAEIQARTGAAADAIAILRRLLGSPAGESVSIARLKIDPVWDPIRNEPGFQQLLTMKEHVGP